jgi:ABC-type transport system involved in Fe-S cluster assembly fused permease/ATPase subunit
LMKRRKPRAKTLSDLRNAIGVVVKSEVLFNMLMVILIR